MWCGVGSSQAIYITVCVGHVSIFVCEVCVCVFGVTAVVLVRCRQSIFDCAAEVLGHFCFTHLGASFIIVGHRTDVADVTDVNALHLFYDRASARAHARVSGRCFRASIANFIFDPCVFYVCSGVTLWLSCRSRIYGSELRHETLIYKAV